MKITRRIVVLIVAIFWLSGCAPPTKEAMTAGSIQGMKRHQHTVTIRVQGGNEIKDESPLRITNDAFSAAIEESIIKNSLFTKVIHGSGSDYIINATIIDISTPAFGASMTARIEVAWTLLNARSRDIVFRKSINSFYTAGAFAAFAGVTRVRIAIEGAARKNIRQALMAISELQLK
ncbi:MAG TPA: hypothetical protein ENI65_12000 [Gammaproteobacteria bacterium]|nr:hypothetical protein [Gammaproteobacteria bacterium]